MWRCGNMKRGSENRYPILAINCSYMGLALAKNPDESQSKNRISLDTRKEVMAFEKKIQPLISLLMLKFAKSLETIQFTIPDGRSVMFVERQWDSYVFRVGAQMQVRFPEEFIYQNIDIDNEQVDFLIRDWIFDINKHIISPHEWANTDLIDGSLISGVPVRVRNTLDLTWEDDITKEELLKNENKRISKLRESLNNLIDTMLPPRQLWPSKPTVKYIKLPILTISQRM